VHEETADVCVIGCGPAGALVASSLAEAGQKVLVVERGRSFTLTERRNVIQRRTELRDAVIEGGGPRAEQARFTSPEVDGRSYESRLGIGVGGATLHWHGAAPRPREDDLATRTRFGYGRDWPLSYAELEPWLLAGERELGVAATDDNVYASPRSGPFPMPAHPLSYFEREILGPAYRRLGWTPHTHPAAVNSVLYAGRMQCQACRYCEVCPSGARYSADLVHVPRLIAAGGRLLDGIQVRRLELSPDGDRVLAAHAVRVSDGEQLVITATKFIVAGGGVETPRLLLLSRRDAAKVAPGLASEALGRGFTDHGVLYYEMAFKQPLGTALGFATMGSDRFRRDGERQHHSTFHFILGPSDYSAGTIRAQLEAGWLRPSGMRDELRRRAAGVVTCELEPSGTLDLDPTEKDAFGDPVARIRLVLTERDRATAKATVKPYQELAGALGVTSMVTAGWEHDAWNFGSHPMGGCVMGTSPADGVCDTSLRVFGVTNLFVASSAVFPQLGSANPTLTIAAMALRLAAQLGGKTASATR
jgi:glucose dehydrogenase